MGQARLKIRYIRTYSSIRRCNKTFTVHIVYMFTDADASDELDPLYIAGITFAALLVFLLLVVIILAAFMMYRNKSKYYDL